MEELTKEATDLPDDVRKMFISAIRGEL